MEFNRVTVSIWAAGFAFVAAMISKSRIAIGVALFLTAVAFLLFIGGAIRVYVEQKRDELSRTKNDN